MIYWTSKGKNKACPIDTLDSSHLENIIKLIQRVYIDTMDRHTGKYDEGYLKLFKAYWTAYQIACNKIITARNRKQDHVDVSFEELIIEGFKTLKEKQFRIGNWVTKEEFLIESQYNSEGETVLDRYHQGAGDMSEDSVNDLYQDEDEHDWKSLSEEY